MRHRDGDQRLADERRPSGEQLVEHTARGVEVAASVGLLAASLLGRDVLRRADDGGRLGERHAGVGKRPGDAEVHDLDLAGPCDHHVARLDVAVDDAGAVAVLERVEHAGDDLDRALRGEPGLLAQQFAQRPALDVLHHDERDPVAVDDVLAGVVDGDDVAVVERRRGLGLAPEPGLEGGVDRVVDAQHLDRDDAAQPPVASPADLRHAAAAESLHPARSDLRGVAARSFRALSWIVDDAHGTRPGPRRAWRGRAGCLGTTPGHGQNHEQQHGDPRSADP